MNVYDFDDTIYDGDSTVDFYLHCLRTHPRIAVCLPKQAFAFALKALHRISTTQLKERFFCFLPLLPDAQALAESFWDQNLRRIRPWYLARKQADDLVISASPAFLLAPACRRLGIRPPIATQADPHTGRISGENCKGAEKVRRLHAVYPDAAIGAFYSDSHSDAPLARLAQEAWLVSGDALKRWEVLPDGEA